MRELEIGKCYKYKSIPGNNIFFKVMNAGCSKYINTSINMKISMAGVIPLNQVHREATEEESRWLNYCIDIDKYVPMDEVPNNTESYELW